MLARRTISMNPIKFVQLDPMPDREESAELRKALQEIDPEIQVSGRAALSAPLWAQHAADTILNVVVPHGLENLVGAVTVAVGLWARKKWFPKKPEREKVNIYGADGRVIKVVERDDRR
jgi:hypothetical protein